MKKVICSYGITTIEQFNFKMYLNRKLKRNFYKNNLTSVTVLSNLYLYILSLIIYFMILDLFLIFI
jgi:hypothetical protein